MTSVVLRLIGDEWKFEEKIAISVPAQGALKMQSTNFAKRLSVPSFSGLTLYYTEGKHPNKVRPTVPVSLDTNPQKEKWSNGVVLWVKVQADQREQLADRRFHESLLAWRKENNIPGILSDGSDVEDFLYEYVSRLNPADSKDIAEMEGEKRSKIEGEEHRGFYVLTFEYREIHALKDLESSARQTLIDDWRFEAADLFRRVLLLPLRIVRQKGIIDAENAARQGTVSEEASLFASLQESSASMKMRIMGIESANRARQESKSAAPSSPTTPSEAKPLLAAEPVRQVNGEAPAAAISAAHLDAIVAAISSSHEKAMDENRKIVGALETRLLGVVGQVRQESADLQLSIHQILRDHQVVSKTIADNARLSSERQLHDRLELLSAQLSSTAAAAEHASLSSGPDVWLGLSDNESRDAVRLLEEQRDLLQGMISAVRKQIEDEQEAEKSLESSALRQVVVSALQAQSVLSEKVEKLENEMLAVSQESEILQQTNSALLEALHRESAKLAAREQALSEAVETVRKHEEKTVALAATTIETRGKFGRDHMTRLSTLGLHPEVFQIIFAVIEHKMNVPHQFVIDGVNQPEYHDYIRERMVDLVLECGSAHQVCDQLCIQLGICCHRNRKQFSRHVEEFAPHLHPTIDLLLDLFDGRELDLFFRVAGWTTSAQNVIRSFDEVKQKHYIYSPLVPGVSQWHS